MRWVMAMLLLVGCPKSRKDGEDLLGPALREADAAWDARGEKGHEPVAQALQRAYALRPESPEVAWRLARLRVAKGLTMETEPERIAAFGEARSLAWDCVRADPRVAALELELGLSSALQEVRPEREKCLLWTAHAWVRWMAEFGGDGAALDLRDLDLVLERARDGGADPWLSGWSTALLLAVRPEWGGRDLAGAAKGLRTALRDDPSHVEPLADLYQYVARGTEDQQDVMQSLAAARPDTPEERAYLSRLLERR